MTSRFLLPLLLLLVLRRRDLFTSAATAAETAALLAFKAGISGDPLSTLSSWTPSGDPCLNFAGVTCSPTGAVVKLLLHSRGLSGELSPSLSSLPSLNIISLFNNSLSGSIPLQVASIPTLHKLNLSRNALSGSVPAALGSIEGLRLLDLSFNSLSGSIPDALFAGCLRTRFVSLAHNLLSGPIPDTFSRCLNLEGVDFSHNRLSGGFPTTICAPPRITVVALGGNLLGGSVGDEVMGCKSLERFDLGSNSFNGAVPFGLLGLRSMSYFNVSFNQFGGEIPAATSCGDRVEVVDVEGNEVGGKIGNGILNCTELRVLNLGSNQLVGGVPAEIGGLKSLSVLRLGSNELMGGEIPPEVGAIELLVVLNLHRMNLSGSIPVTISNLRFLLDLDLSGNHLDGEIPQNLYNITYLKVLDLHSNGLSGSIPPGISALVGLECLDLSENSLNGSIPDTLGDLTRLQNFNLSYNNLSGEIPPEDNIRRFGAAAFSHNAGLCGIPLNNVCGETGGTRSRKLLSVSAIVAIVAAAVIFTGVCAITVVNLWLRTKKMIWKDTEGVEEEEVLVSESLTAASAGTNLIVGKLVLFSKRLPSRYEDWETGTKALLDKDCIVGGGTIGTVYKASLEGGVSIAVKKLETLGKIRSQDEFEQEISRLGNVRHPNLVEVQGYYWSTTMQLILMEFVTNGNLSQHLHGYYNGASELHWPRRFDIALGTARALAYLHHDCKPQILHLNIKAANILLDENYQPKLSDYGLIKLLPMLGSNGMSKFHSAAGYVAPELAAQSLSYSDKSDVYSFGVVLLEIVTGRKPVERSGASIVVLCDDIRRLIESGNAAGCFDRSLRGFAENELTQVLKLGLICTVDDSSRRPSMAEVVQFLESIKPARDSNS